MYKHFRGKKLPEESFLQNAVIREFGVPREHARRCAQIFVQNLEFVGLLRKASTGLWVGADVAAGQVSAPGETPIESGEGVDSGDDLLQPISHAEPIAGATGLRPPAVTHVPVDERAKRVFVTHGKNKAFIPQLKELLAFGQLEPVVSIERESVSKAVPDKVLGEMRSCGAAVIHVDAERRLLKEDGSTETALNQNVLIEIGCAMALYGNRFILLVKDGVGLPSNLQGLYEVRYQGDKLDGDATIRLLKAFNEMKTQPLMRQ